MKARRVLSKAKKSNQEEIEQFNIDGYEANKVERVVEDKKEELYTFGEAVKMMQTGVEMSVKGSGIIVGIKSATENTNEYMYTYKENKKTPYNATLDDLLSEEWCKIGE